MTTAEIINGLNAVRTIDNGNYAQCPKCKKYIRFSIAYKYNKCPECGQAIKWKEEVAQALNEFANDLERIEKEDK